MVDLKLELRYDFAFEILVGNFFCKKLKYIDKDLNVNKTVESTSRYKEYYFEIHLCKTTKRGFDRISQIVRRHLDEKK